MHTLRYVTCDPVNEDAAERWADACGAQLAIRNLLREVETDDDDAVVIDWDFCLDRDCLLALLACWSDRVCIAVHGYSFSDDERAALHAHGVAVYRHELAALEGVSIALAQVA